MLQCIKIICSNISILHEYHESETTICYKLAVTLQLSNKTNPHF